LYNARAKTADLQTDINRQRLLDFQNNLARYVRDAWEDLLSWSPTLLGAREEAFEPRALKRCFPAEQKPEPLMAHRDY
jgi:hypothetical protein